MKRRANRHQLPALGVCILLFLGALSATADTLQVPADHATIQAALNAASSGDTVLVSPGTYNESSLSFGSKDLILKSTSGPASTIIDAGNSARVFDLGGSQTRASVIEGFTIQNGYSAAGGGGMRLVGSSPTIRGNWIIDNLAEGTGGGIKAMLGSNPLIELNLISGNTAYDGGGGVHVAESAADIRNNDITGNIATQELFKTGGGVKVTFSTGTVTVRNNLLSMNEISGAGGGVSCFVCDLDVIDNVIVDNTAGELAGGVLFEADDAYPAKTALISGNEISRNTAPIIGGAIHTYLENTASSVEIVDNVMEDNETLNPSECASAAGNCGKGGALGLYLGNGSAQQTVRDNTIRGNRGDQYGAALLIGTGTGTATFVFEDNLVEANTSRFGFPGLSCVGTGGCQVARNRFHDNQNDAATISAARNPGAAFLNNSGVTVVENNYFRGNTGYHAGAIVLISIDPSVANPQMLNNTFVGNTTSVSFGGTVWIEAPTMLANNIFTGDLRGVRTSGSPAMEVHNNDFYDMPSVYRDDTTHNTVSSLNGESFASGNVDLDPDFLFADDLYLSVSSPLLNLGRCDLAPADDFDSSSRPNGPGCEIGADEYDPNDLLIFADGFESGDTSAW